MPVARELAPGLGLIPSLLLGRGVESRYGKWALLDRRIELEGMEE